MTPGKHAKVEAAAAAHGDVTVDMPSAWESWARHLVEMVVVMMLGMMVLSYPVTAIAGALGYRDLASSMPGVAILLMAAEMTLPMALWMAYRGHRRRAVAEMSAVMAAPAAALAAATALGLALGTALVPMYHAAMMVAMVGFMLFRRDEYSRHPSGGTPAGLARRARPSVADHPRTTPADKLDHDGRAPEALRGAPVPHELPVPCVDAETAR